MMKKLFSCLLTIVLLLSLAVTIGAVDGEDPDETTSENENSGVVILPSEAELPDGYEVDEDFSMTITFGAENNWTYVFDELIEEADDEYIYFVVENDVAEGYYATYAINGIFSSDGGIPGASTGNVVVVKNVKEGDSPTYELPKSGGVGTAVYTAVGAGFLTAAALYGLVLICKKKANAE